jgi:hypothetical protein
MYGWDAYRNYQAQRPMTRAEQRAHDQRIGELTAAYRRGGRSLLDAVVAPARRLLAGAPSVRRRRRGALGAARPLTSAVAASPAGPGRFDMPMAG